MRILLFILTLPLFSIAQNPSQEKLHYRSVVSTDSGMVKGYLLYTADSVIILSPQKNYVFNSPTTIIPVNSIRSLHIKKKGEYNALGSICSTVLGFTLAAGLLQNKDLDGDDRTSFFELIWGAVEGTTSSDRNRRTTSLIVGAAGGTVFLLASLLSGRKFSLSFPKKDRNTYYQERKTELDNFVKF